MKYEKPALLTYAAIAAIQESGPTTKWFDPTTDGSPAYQSDE